MYKLPPLPALRAFEAAARHLSFKQAAAELGVTPTAISHQIRLLERYCGRALFRRRPRPLSLTEAGALLFPVIQDGLRAFSTAIAAVRREEYKQPLRVTTTNAFASRWLVPRLPTWRIAQPNVPLEVIGTDSVLDLNVGDVDLAIRYSRIPPPEGHAEELLRDSFWPVCSPQLLQSGESETKPTDLKKHTLVHCYWSPSDTEAPTWHRWLAAARSRWHNVPDFKDMDHLSFQEELHAIEAVISGQGVGIFSDVLVSAELASGTLVKVFDLHVPGYGFYLTWKPDHHRVKVIADFARWLKSVI